MGQVDVHLVGFVASTVEQRTGPERISSSASSGVITFPSAFPNACIAIFAHDFAIASTDLSNVRFYMPGRTSASWTGQNMSNRSAGMAV
ncbi:gp53-like domain-containing protein [Escherichia coli]